VTEEHIVSFKHGPQAAAFLKAVMVTRQQLARAPICSDDALISVHGDKRRGGSTIGWSDCNDPLSTEPLTKAALFDCPRRRFGQRTSQGVRLF
jgi:hypothetical protein